MKKLDNSPLRSKETNDRYLDLIKKGEALTTFKDIDAIEEWGYWKIVPDQFPYDRISKTHHLLVPKRIFASSKDMTAEERKEYESILETYAKENYDVYIKKLSDNKTVPGHYHLHLLTLKKV